MESNLRILQKMNILVLFILQQVTETNPHSLIKNGKFTENTESQQDHIPLIMTLINICHNEQYLHKTIYETSKENSYQNTNCVYDIE